MSVKAGAVEAFTELIESEIIPLVRHQKGFQDALTLIVPGSREAIGISVGTAKTFQISNSTFHKIGTRVSL
jgi:hypothetical protein